MLSYTVEFSELCPSGQGYIPVEGAWTFGQAMYTGNCPQHSPQMPLGRVNPGLVLPEVLGGPTPSSGFHVVSVYWALGLFHP